MVMRVGEINTVSKVFYSPLVRAYDKARDKRDCAEFSDEHFLRAGVGRCLNDVRSGRDWIQKAMMVLMLPITVSRFFLSLKSERRLNFLGSVAKCVQCEVDKKASASDDPFSGHAELDGFGIYAADGHYHGSSSHEETIEGKCYPVGHYYSMNLRTQSILHLDVARPKHKREHEITALKRLEANALRMGEPKGKKVILAYDSAIYDFLQWKKWKQSKGIYIITLMKENTCLQNCSDREFDLKDPRNNGILSDQIGKTKNGVILRKIVYIDPSLGKVFTFLTNEMTLPPGLIAFIYKKRWDIEKVFDQFKNKLMEKKAWAKSPNSKCVQAKFMALTHNLILLLERKIEVEEGISDIKIEKKKQQRINEDLKKIRKAGRKENPLVKKPYKAVQRQQFSTSSASILFRTGYRLKKKQNFAQNF